MSIKRVNGRHGLCKSPAYRSWTAMKARCYSENNNRYHLYGARGITVCDRWLYSFKNFLDDMGEKPSRKHTIERDDGDKGYSPDNCRWATASEQSRNHRELKRYEVDGKMLLPCEIDEAKGYARGIVGNRLAMGWTAKQAIETDPSSSRRRDITGTRKGRLVAVKLAETRGRRMYWEWKCDCGKTHVARIDAVLQGKISSCGCLRKELRKC